jgi:uncharacterized membrane protein YhaH (DUF805 family)
MTFFEAVAKCYRKYLVFSGRASKREYWWFVLLTFLFVWPLFLAEIGTGTWYGFLSFVYFMLTISTVLPLSAVWTRRMHDVGKSAWHGFFILIPIIGFILVFRWLTKDGDVGKNKYGAPDNYAFVIKRKDTGDDLLEDLSV